VFGLGRNYKDRDRIGGRGLQSALVQQWYRRGDETDVMAELQLQVNGKRSTLTDDLALKGPRFGCGLGQCGCCSVLADGLEIRSCITPVSRVAGKSLTTLEGLPAYYAARMKVTPAPELHPLQQAMIAEQAVQCGYCYNGQIIKGADGHICRCGTYPRIVAAIHRAAKEMAEANRA
jgi:aerobic-type carbon monoxide dehydrogenase small subunit (CoxS/CutS family)